MPRRINVALFLLLVSTGKPYSQIEALREEDRRPSFAPQNTLLRTNLRRSGNNMIAHTFYRMHGNKIYSTEISP